MSDHGRADNLERRALEAEADAYRARKDCERIATELSELKRVMDEHDGVTRRLQSEAAEVRRVLVEYANAFDATQKVVGIQTAAAYEEKTLLRSDALVEVLRIGRRLRAEALR